MANKMSADEKRWRAESDAGALKRALEIQRDPERYREANKYIQKELNDLAKITGTKIIPPKKQASKKR